jgi:hypothetical protein
VSTPGSYSLKKKRKSKIEKRKEKEREKKRQQQREKYRKEKEKHKKKQKPRGRPSLSVKKARTGKYRANYTAADMDRAISMVQEDDYSVARAAEICGVPRITLLNKIHGTHTKEVGRPNVLSEAEETALVEVCVQMGQFNYPLTKRHLSEMVKNYLDKTRETRFVDNKPGREWVKKFLARHKDRIVVRKANNIRRSRAAVSPAIIREYFANLEKELEGIPPSHILNCDESCLQDNPSAQKCIFQKGCRYPEQAGVYTVLVT